MSFSAPVPRPPVGFEVTPKYHLQTLIEPAGVYLATIRLMSGLSMQPRSAEADLDHFTIVTGGAVAISNFQREPGTRARPHHRRSLRHCIRNVFSTARVSSSSIAASISLSRKMALMYMSPTLGSQRDTTSDTEPTEGA